MQGLTPVKNLLGQNGMQSIKPPQTKPTSSTVNEPRELPEKIKLPPLIRTLITPDALIRSTLTEGDYTDMVKHLQAYQKNGGEWDVYRKKIPEDLLVKFKELLRLCRQSGFIGPKVENGQMVFKQITSRNRNADKCTLCDNSLIDGSCKGRMRLVNHRIQFGFCWVG